MAASIDSKLEALLESIRSYAAARSAQLQNGEPAGWARPSNLDYTEEKQADDNYPDTHDGSWFNEGISGEFQLSDAEEQFLQLYSSEISGTFAEQAALKIQLDHAAQLERAYRARHAAGFARSAVHSAVTHTGLGDPSGSLTGSLVDYCVELLKRGASSGNGNP